MAVPTVQYDETSPAGSDNIASGDNKIREFKTQVREIMAVDHEFTATQTASTGGQHKQVTLQEQANLGTGAVSATILGSQTVSGKGELMYTDEDDNDIQLTNAGTPIAINNVTAKTLPIIADAILINDSAASNVSKSCTLSNLLKIVYPVGSIYMNADETVGSVNPATTFGFGTWSPMVDEVVVGKNSSGTFNTLGTLSAGSETVTLTASQMPSHTHDLTGSATGTPGTSLMSTGDGTNTQTVKTTTSAGSGSSHNNIQPTYVAYMWRRTA